MSTHQVFLDSLYQLLQQQRHGSLGTLTNQGLPFVSMVPFALDAAHGRLLIHISDMAAHTRYLKERPQASIMICQTPSDDAPVHDLPRVTLQIEASLLERNTPEREAARDVYLARFPDVAFMTDFTDFHFFALSLQRVRHVAGFGAARTLQVEEVCERIRQGL